MRLLLKPLWKPLWKSNGDHCSHTSISEESPPCKLLRSFCENLGVKLLRVSITNHKKVRQRFWRNASGKFFMEPVISKFVFEAVNAVVIVFSLITWYSNTKTVDWRSKLRRRPAKISISKSKSPYRQKEEKPGIHTWISPSGFANIYSSSVLVEFSSIYLTRKYFVP